MDNKYSKKGYMPQVGTIAFSGWFQDMSFIKEHPFIDDNGEANIKEEIVRYYGTFQPLKGRTLEIKSYEQRAWAIMQIHSTTDLSLSNGDRISYNDKKYKVMTVFDYNLNGFYEYHVTEDFSKPILGVDII
jgi:hypothetical protein